MEGSRKFKLYTGKVVELVPMLTGGQTDTLYRIIGSDLNQARLAICNAIAHLVSIDGTAVLPLSNQLAFQGVLNRFDEAELGQLVECYGRVAQASELPEIEELKNE